jgi:butyryl-CoA dehydrogenase
MDYSLEKYKNHLSSVRAFVQETVAPAAQSTDENELFPQETVAQMKNKGFFGIPFDVRLGGAGQDYIAYALMIEEIAKACASTAVILSTHTSLCAYPVAKFANKEQKERFLRPLLTGDLLGAFALTEPGAGSDVNAIASTAE